MYVSSVSISVLNQQQQQQQLRGPGVVFEVHVGDSGRGIRFLIFILFPCCVFSSHTTCLLGTTSAHQDHPITYGPHTNANTVLQKWLGCTLRSSSCSGFCDSLGGHVGSMPVRCYHGEFVRARSFCTTRSLVARRSPLYNEDRFVLNAFETGHHKDGHRCE